MTEIMLRSRLDSECSPKLDKSTKDLKMNEVLDKLQKE
jgi:hypothetical protein